MKPALAFAFLLLLALFLMLGCAQGIPQAPSQNAQAPEKNAPPSQNAQSPQQSPQPSSGAQATSQQEEDPDYLPEPDCLGITAEKLQSACGSGPILRTITPVYEGYKCTYSAIDTEGFGGLSEIEGKAVLGVQAELAYMGPRALSGKSFAEWKAEAIETEKPDSATDLTDGFYTAHKFPLLSGRTGEAIAVFAKKGPVVQVLRGGDSIDYESFGLFTSLGCSLPELLELSGYSPGTASSGGKAEVPKVPAQEESTAENEVCPCKAFIASQAGVVETKEGKQMNPGDELAIGDKLYAFDADITIAVLCGDDLNNIKIFVIKAGEETVEISIAEGEDGKPAVEQDPGTATVSVKELAQFETDFQVSTPRLTCSVRG